MNEPTEQEWKEFCERCGIKEEKIDEFHSVWHYPEGTHEVFEPQLDLNTLFEYAVPKLKTGHERTLLVMWMVKYIQDWAMGKDLDPAFSLFWTLRKVI